ncbi:hypothetical protein EBAPG3_010360 [Nitrosospira lacus]|uniref:Uncharacterized protein n=1 Tax=Nitrosospira lacus TaxID=1288494 RepID=A0A1W6SQP5_9PROT|nr:hypothetical protein [Nitrosospira lacus]ARO88144.1 hypothetical protein EBAPG3_010360 [Nitrosospira lacus]
MSLDTVIGTEGAREAVITALQLPAPLGKLIVQYLALFRPAQRQLSFDRVNTILNELLPMISSGKIERNGRIWAAPTETWRIGIEEMLAKRDKLTLPLKGHGYLLTIIAGYTDKAEAKAEAKSEDRRAGRTAIGGQIGKEPDRAEPAPQRSPMPQSVKQQLGKFTSRGNDDDT